MAEKLDIRTIHNGLAEKEFVVFAGTGIVHGSGVPSSWEKFMERLGKEAEIPVGGRSEEEYPNPTYSRALCIHQKALQGRF